MTYGVDRTLVEMQSALDDGYEDLVIRIELWTNGTRFVGQLVSDAEFHRRLTALLPADHPSVPRTVASLAAVANDKRERSVRRRAVWAAEGPDDLPQVLHVRVADANGDRIYRIRFDAVSAWALTEFGVGAAPTG